MISAGIVLLRRTSVEVQMLLVHPGGPFWASKDAHAWSIPKGLVDATDGEGADIEAAARREFHEETGHRVPNGGMTPLPPLRIGSGKWLHAFVVRGDLDASTIESNRFEMEWPPRSGRMQSYPEVDRGAWYSLDDARAKLHKGQVPLIDLVTESIHPDDADW